MKTTRQAGAEPAFRAVALSALKTILATNSVACHRAGAGERHFALLPIRVNFQPLSRRNTMGRPLGSLNREKPFKTALQMALRERPQSLRLIANRLIDAAETGDLPSIRARRTEQRVAWLVTPGEGAACTDHRIQKGPDVGDAEAVCRSDGRLAAD